MKYRKEIDGLRALALLPIILFHAGFAAFGGGFVGVDIFFVISGYLITTNIVNELEEGSFSLLNFYEKRARRILPALFFVMLCTLPFAWFWMLPQELKGFSESLVAVPLFSSNVLFYQTNGYFNTASELKPLLHTWSLAVEEQYYAIFPLFLLATWKFGKTWIISSLLMMVVTSVAVAQWCSLIHPSFNFYLLPTRGFALFIGALISFYINRKFGVPIRSDMVSQSASIIGLVLIVYAIFGFDDKTPYPSVYALVPTLGAGLILIFANNKNAVGRLLGNKIVVTVGLISYSTYLWHQPLLAFARLESLDAPTNGNLVLICFCSLVLGYLSWRLVEKPFRKMHFFSRGKFLNLSLLFSLFFIIIGYIGYETSGFYEHYSKNLTSNQKKIFSYLNMNVDNIWREGTCSLRPNQTYKEFSVECINVDKSKASLLIWGDSYAASLSEGLRENHGNVAQFTASACPPLIGTLFLGHPNCRLINDFVVQQIEQTKPAKVFLMAKWNAYYPRCDVIEILKNTISSIKAKSPSTDISIIGSLPQYDRLLPELMLKRGMELDGIHHLTTPKYKKLLAIDSELKNLAFSQKVNFKSALDIFCNQNWCQITSLVDGHYEPTTFDYGHLTEAGSILLANGLLKDNNR